MQLEIYDFIEFMQNRTHSIFNNIGMDLALWGLAPTICNLRLFWKFSSKKLLP